MSRIGAIVKKIYGLRPDRAAPEKRSHEWKRRIQKFRDVATSRRSLTTVIIIVIILFVVFIIAESIFQYNLLCSWEVVTEARQADVDKELQRRKNLIPNLVFAVEKYAVHEQAVFRYVSDAREAMKMFRGMDGVAGGANNDFSKALSGLIALAEQYPLLRATQSIEELMTEATETENRIAAAKKEYNRVTEIYNQYRTVFPGNMFAFLYGFKSAGYIDTEESLDVPLISMNIQKERDGIEGNTAAYARSLKMSEREDRSVKENTNAPSVKTEGMEEQRGKGKEGSSKTEGGKE